MPRNGAGGSAQVKAYEEPVVLAARPLVQAPVTPRTRGRAVPLAQLAPNPQNLRGDDLYASPADRDRLVAQLRENGQIQACVVLDLDVYLEHYPQDAAEFSPEHKWVLVAGHCRRDAAPDAGLEELRIEVQNHYVTKLTEVFLGENLGRTDLTVFQEGEGYRRLAEQKQWSHQQIADNAGVGKSRVTKRIALMRLRDIPEARNAVLSGRLGVDTAYNLLVATKDPSLVLPAWDHMRAGDLTAKQAAHQVLLGSAPSPAGQKVSPPATVGPDAEEGASQREAALAVPPARSEPVLAEPTESAEVSSAPTTVKPVPATPPTPADHERARTDARRAEVCRKLVAEYTGTDVSPEAVRVATTLIMIASKAGTALAHSWMRAAGAENADTLDASSFRDTTLLSGDPGRISALAYAVSLAEGELRASDARRKPDLRVIGHWRHLIEVAGYAASPWEEEFLK